jgi:hypothetical protein
VRLPAWLASRSGTGFLGVSRPPRLLPVRPSPRRGTATTRRSAGRAPSRASASSILRLARRCPKTPRPARMEPSSTKSSTRCPAERTSRPPVECAPHSRTRRSSSTSSRRTATLLAEEKSCARPARPVSSSPCNCPPRPSARSSCAREASCRSSLPPRAPSLPRGGADSCGRRGGPSLLRGSRSGSPMHFTAGRARAKRRSPKQSARRGDAWSRSSLCGRGPGPGCSSGRRRGARRASKGERLRAARSPEDPPRRANLPRARRRPRRCGRFSASRARRPRRTSNAPTGNAPSRPTPIGAGARRRFATSSGPMNRRSVGSHVRADARDEPRRAAGGLQSGDSRPERAMT